MFLLFHEPILGKGTQLQKKTFLRKFFSDYIITMVKTFHVGILVPRGIPFQFLERFLEI